MRSDGSDLRQVTRSAYYSLDAPHFSSDGKTILYSAVSHGGGGLDSSDYSVEANGRSAPSQICPGSECIYSPASADIAFVTDIRETYQYDVALADPIGHVKKYLGLTRKCDYNATPQYSRDGRAMYYLSCTLENGHVRPWLRRFDLETGGISEVATPELFDSPLTFVPK